jgi:hypothetical protein
MKEKSPFTSVIVFLFLVAISIYGCKKDNLPDSYISFSMNGQQQNYTKNAIALQYSNDTLHRYSLKIFAYNSDTSHSISVSLFSFSPIKTNADYSSSDTLGSLQQPVTIEWDIYTRCLNCSNINSGFLFPNNVNLKITAITPTYIQGTFSGNLSSAYNGPITLITNGRFKVKIQ